MVTIHIFSSTYLIYIISQGTTFHYGTISTDSGCMSVSNHFLNSFDALAKRSAGLLAPACPCGLTGWQGQRRWVPRACLFLGLPWSGTLCINKSWSCSFILDESLLWRLCSERSHTAGLCVVRVSCSGWRGQSPGQSLEIILRADRGPPCLLYRFSFPWGCLPITLSLVFCCALFISVLPSIFIYFL